MAKEVLCWGGKARCQPALGVILRGRGREAPAASPGLCQPEIDGKRSPFSHPSSFVYKSSPNAFYYLWGNGIKQEISMAFSPPDLCWSIFSSPHTALPILFPAPPKLPREQSCVCVCPFPVIASQFQGLRINNIVITHFTNFQEEILPQQMRAALIFAK